MGMEKNTAPLKKHVWSLGILNLLDGILTYVGLLSGVITEANPLLATFSPLTLLVTKLFLSLCLFAFLYTPFIRIQSRSWRYAFMGVNTLYTFILLLHMYWLPFLFAR